MEVSAAESWGVQGSASARRRPLTATLLPSPTRSHSSRVGRTVSPDSVMQPSARRARSTFGTSMMGLSSSANTDTTVELPGPTVMSSSLSSSLTSTSVAEVLRLQKEPPCTCYADEPVIEVARRLLSKGAASNKASMVYARSDTQQPLQLVGLFSQSDYYEDSAAAVEGLKEYVNSPVSQYMAAAPLVSVGLGESAAAAVARMGDNGIRHLVVVDDSSSGEAKEGAVVGLISMADVLAAGALRDEAQLEQLVASASAASVDEVTQMAVPDATDMAVERALELADARREASGLGGIDNAGVFRGESVLLGALLLIALLVACVGKGWLSAHVPLAMTAVFVLGYVGIIFEEVFELNKASIALLMAVLTWVIYVDDSGAAGAVSQLGEKLAEVSDICFFLLAAETIVEVVDENKGFKVLTDVLAIDNRRTLFWAVGGITFFLSAILNNLTVTVVMVSLMRKLLPDVDERRLFGSMIVLAANAGGVWTPIGDVTTTMLWINGQLSTNNTIVDLFLPGLVSVLVPMYLLQPPDDQTATRQATADGKLESPPPPPRLPAVYSSDTSSISNLAAAQDTSSSDGFSITSVFSSAAPEKRASFLVALTGLAALLSVPVFTELTDLPPYLGMLAGLGVLWTVTDALLAGNETDSAEKLRVPHALAKIDVAGILFFFGVLMAIGAVESAGLLKDLAEGMDAATRGVPFAQELIAILIGMASAVIDNVPLVAATMGMYDLSAHPIDDRLWQLIAYCAGTGGSILIIGSASGVALMGLEKVDFLWYLKKIAGPAFVGYLAGAATYVGTTALASGLQF